MLRVLRTRSAIRSGSFGLNDDQFAKVCKQAAGLQISVTSSMMVHLQYQITAL